MSTPLITKHGLHRVNTDMLLASDALQGPFRRTRPVTLTWRKRLSRWLAGVLRDINTRRTGAAGFHGARRNKP